MSFYADLPPLTSFAQVADPAGYRPAPGDWWVAVADVEGSTQAVRDGRYREVNAVGVSCIVAALNAARGEELPFVFGGDGASLLVPPHLEGRVAAALAGVRRLAAEALSLTLRVGLVPVQTLTDRGRRVLVARLALPGSEGLAMFQGGGLELADALVKRSDRWHVPEAAAVQADLRGFECRWEPIPSARGKVVCVLIRALDDDDDRRAETWRDVLDTCQHLVDAVPVGADRLQLKRRLAGTPEAVLRGHPREALGRLALLAYMAAETAAGRALLATGLRTPWFRGDSYRQEVTERTDFRKLDDVLRMVLDLSEDQRVELEAVLTRLEAQGRVQWGLHASGSALMTCLIRDGRRRHLHFVDGSEGGYSLAAAALKRKSAVAEL